MGKLHLKETPEERSLRAEKKSERKHRKHRHRSPDGHGKPENKRRRRNSHTDPAVDNLDEDRPMSPPLDLDELKAQIEDGRFREKLHDAMLDDYDNRLDSIEAQLNEYAHVPRRWHSATGSSIHDDNVATDPNLMDDDEYAEWIREGMWRRTHKAEMEERDRREAEARARKEREKAARKESRRLEREAEVKRTANQELKAHRRHQEALKYYDTRWQECTSIPDQSLRFTDIPWPVFPVVTTTATITEERISEFIFYQLDKDNSKGRRERIREALLRWHPDKFESKLGSRIGEEERALILEGVGIVARSLNNMMNGG